MRKRFFYSEKIQIAYIKAKVKKSSRRGLFADEIVLRARKLSHRGLLGKIFDKLRIQGRMQIFEKKVPECFKSRFDTLER